MRGGAGVFPSDLTMAAFFISPPSVQMSVPLPAWGKVHLLGHLTIVGQLRAAELAGSVVLHVLVPGRLGTDTHEALPSEDHLFPLSSVHRIELVSEDQVLEEIARSRRYQGEKPRPPKEPPKPAPAVEAADDDGLPF